MTDAGNSVDLGDRPEPMSLEDEQGRLVAIPAAGRNTVLVFYRGDFCPYCNAQLASYARQWEPFAAANASVFGISVDPRERNAGMVEKLILPFPLLSDPEGSAIRAYGVWNEEKQEAHPALFVIDRDGAIRYVYRGEDFTDRPGDAELYAALRAGDRTAAG